jgi:DNA-binding transcriptional LysR family regulator
MQRNEFSRLAAFVAVAEQRHFAKAAAQLGMSPSNLTHAIRSLEERLGIRLLNRTTRWVSLTPAGERLLHQMQPIMRAMNDALDAMNAFRDSPGGQLRLSVTRSVAASLLEPLLPAFFKECPDIALEIITDDSDADIVHDGVDAGIRFGEWISKDMIAVRLLDAFRMVTVASPAYLAAHPPITTPEDLRAHNCILRRMTKDGAIHRWDFVSNERRLTVAVAGSLVVNDSSLAVRAAIEGIGVARLSEMSAAAALAKGELVPLLEAWAPRYSGLFLYYPSRRQMPAALRAFVDFVQRHRGIVQLNANVPTSRASASQQAVAASSRASRPVMRSRHVGSAVAPLATKSS